MKKSIFLAYSLTFILMFSCKKAEIEYSDSEFYFTEPQPADDSELKSIPAKFRGVYQDHNGTLNINENSMYYEYTLESAIAKSDLDSLKNEVTFKNGKLINLKTSEVYNAIDKGDSLYINDKHGDTVFKFGNKNIAKRMNGYMVLNTLDSLYWQTSILSIQNDSLHWKQIAGKESYVALVHIVKNISATIDTTIVHLSPTRKEFKKMLSLKDLGYSRQYKKLK